MKRAPFARTDEDDEREPSWYEKTRAQYDDDYDRFQPRHQQTKLLERPDFTQSGEDYTKKVVEPAIKQVCEDTGIRHAPNEQDCRRNLDNPDYYVRDWDVDEFNALPFYDALNLYKKFCKKYLVDMRMFKRPRKERRQEVFAQVLEANQDLNDFVQDNDRLIEQRHQEIKYRFEKVIPKLWDALTSRAEFAEFELQKANKYKTWEKRNFDENDEALRRLREYLKIPPTTMQRQDRHGPSVCEIVKTKRGMKRLLKEGAPYTEPDLKRLRRVHAGNRSVRKILSLLEGEVKDREEEVKEYDLEQPPYNQLTEQEMRALYAWAADGENERTHKWRRALQRRIRNLDKEPLERRESQLSTSSLESVLAPGELFSQVEEEMREKERRDEEEAKAAKKREGGVLQSLLEMVGSDSESEEESEREPRKAQLPVSRETPKVSPLDKSRSGDVEAQLLAHGILQQQEDGEDQEITKIGNTKGEDEETGETVGFEVSAEDQEEIATFTTSLMSSESGSRGSQEVEELDTTAPVYTGKMDDELPPYGHAEDIKPLARVSADVEEDDEEEVKTEEVRDGEEALVSDKLRQLEPIAAGEEDLEEEVEEKEEDQKRRKSMLGRISAFVNGYRRKSSRSSSGNEGGVAAIAKRQSHQLEAEDGYRDGGRTRRKGPVYVRPKVSTRRAKIPSAAAELEDNKAAPTNVLTTGRIFELALQGKLAESAQLLLDSWDGPLDWDNYLKDVGFVRISQYQDEDLLQSRFGKHFKIVKLLAQLCERKFVANEALSLSEESQLVTHNGREMQKVYDFELNLAARKAGVRRSVVSESIDTKEEVELGRELEEEKEEDTMDRLDSREDRVTLSTDEEIEEQDEEEHEEEGDGKILGEVEPEEITVQGVERLGASGVTTKEAKGKSRDDREGTTEAGAREGELQQMPPPKPRLESSGNSSGALVATTQLEPPGPKQEESESAQRTVSEIKRSNGLQDDISSDVSLVHAARSFELGLLGKLAREATRLLESPEWRDQVQWDEYLENMHLWRVKDLKDRQKVVQRFPKEASVINALVLICEQAMIDRSSLTRPQEAAVRTHNGQEMLSVFEFDKKFEEFLNK